MFYKFKFELLVWFIWAAPPFKTVFLQKRTQLHNKDITKKPKNSIKKPVFCISILRLSRYRGG